MAHPLSKPVPIKKAGIKTTPATRITAGGKIAGAAPKSSFYSNEEMQTAVDNLGASTIDVAARVSAFNDAKAAFVKAGTALDVAVLGWDGCFDVVCAVGAKLFLTADDAASCALPVATRTRHALTMPLGVTMKQDLEKGIVRIHVDRAPGMTSVCTEISTDPTNPTLWKELDGWGADHVLDKPAPGALWARAASRTAKAKSGFTDPVLLTVK